MPVVQVLRKFTKKKRANCRIFRVINHIHVDHVDRGLWVRFTRCKTLQHLVINLLLNCQNDFKLKFDLLKPLWTRLRKLIILLTRISDFHAYFDSTISFHDVKHSVFGIKSFIFGFEVSEDRIIGGSKRISIWLPLRLSWYLYHVSCAVWLDIIALFVEKRVCLHASVHVAGAHNSEPEFGTHFWKSNKTLLEGWLRTNFQI